jgi:hypothetical protein
MAAPPAETLEREEHHLRELRTFCRECLHELRKERRNFAFLAPVSTGDFPDYLTVVKEVRAFAA